MRCVEAWGGATAECLVVGNVEEGDLRVRLSHSQDCFHALRPLPSSLGARHGVEGLAIRRHSAWPDQVCKKATLHA